ncbi:phosphate acyltransferase [Parachlamydia sp. AcF125]|uniref:phosphate acyltransferase n=1 Tax=Parachlamydia sp. AcF125 TaxID=2795736 RepID=UPI001BC9B030|nr:phosphate acyltransferase [Parachlamydia sp. AcF125]MBS4168019.1 Phosphate acyltransferase [Parachlamydia sp. AcF125]
MRKQKEKICVGIDLMGSDSSPQVLFDAVLKAAALHPALSMLVFVPEKLWDYFQKKIPPPLQITCVGVSQEILMEDHPLEAIRRKRHSSLVQGIQLLKEKKIEGFVSAGNTGALIATATLNVPLLPTIKRPALLITMPTEKGKVAVIDAGGNITCKAENYVQFAQLGAIFQKCLASIGCPTVGLLNVGAEPLKGPHELRKAYQELQRYTQTFSHKGKDVPLEFRGNVESKDVFCGNVDVVVTDGFSGNILLKSCEGVSSLIFKLLRNALGNFEQLDAIEKLFDYAEYPGGLLCGLERVVVKCHGSVTPRSMLNCISGAVHFIEQNLVERMREQLLLLS